MSEVKFLPQVGLGPFEDVFPRGVAEIVWGYFCDDVAPMTAYELSDQVQLTFGITSLVEVSLAPGHRLSHFASHNNCGDIRLNLPGSAERVHLSSMPDWDIDLTGLERLTHLRLQSLGHRYGPILYGLENIKNVTNLNLCEIWGAGVSLEGNFPELKHVTIGFIYTQVAVSDSAVGLVSLHVTEVDHEDLVLMGINPGVECLTLRNVWGTHDFSSLPNTLKNITLLKLCEAFDLSGLELPDDAEVLTVEGDGHRLATVEWLGPIVDGGRKPGRYFYDITEKKII